MTLIEFIDKNFSASLLAFIATCAFLYLVLGMLLRMPLIMWNRWLRSRNIARHGWPPPHCDADGDSYTPDRDEDDPIIYRWADYEEWRANQDSTVTMREDWAAKAAFEAARDRT